MAPSKRKVITPSSAQRSSRRINTGETPRWKYYTRTNRGILVPRWGQGRTEFYPYNRVVSPLQAPPPVPLAATNTPLPGSRPQTPININLVPPLPDSPGGTNVYSTPTRTRMAGADPLERFMNAFEQRYGVSPQRIIPAQQAAQPPRTAARPRYPWRSRGYGKALAGRRKRFWGRARRYPFGRYRRRGPSIHYHVY